LALACRDLGHLVEHVDRLVHPAPLLASLAIDFTQRPPKSQGAVADGQLGADLQTAAFEVEQQFAPALRAFTITVDQSDDVLVSLGVGGDDHQHALLVVIEAG